MNFVMCKHKSTALESSVCRIFSGRITHFWVQYKADDKCEKDDCYISLQACAWLVGIISRRVQFVDVIPRMSHEGTF